MADQGCAERIGGQMAGRADDVRKMLAAQGWVDANDNEHAICSVCAAQITYVVEEHTSYWEATDGDSLSYVPTLHDHQPDPDITEDSLAEFGLALERKVTLKFLMSTGGPADWLEILCDQIVRATSCAVSPDHVVPGALEIERVTYHFSDWFDHAEQEVTDGPLFELAEYLAEGQSY